MKKEVPYKELDDLAVDGLYCVPIPAEEKPDFNIGKASGYADKHGYDVITREMLEKTRKEGTLD